MAKPGSEKLEKALRKRLTALLPEGLVPFNVYDRGGELLELGIVTSRLDPDAVDDDDVEAATAYAAALTAVMLEAVRKRRVKNPQHRRILRRVLPLKEELLGTTIGERRAAAGERISDGRTIQPDTIRTYPGYEPGALDALAHALVEMEFEHRRGGSADPPSDAG